LILDEDGELEVIKKAQTALQMLTCIQASFTQESALILIKNRDSKELITDGPLYLRINIDSRYTVFVCS